MAINRRDLDVLRILQREQGRIVSRRMLLQEAWGYAQAEEVATRSVDMHVVKLRRKLISCCADDIIHTVRGEGYRVHGVGV